MVIGSGSGGIPVAAGFDGPSSIVAQEGAGIGVAGSAANVFESPVERLDAAIVVGGPAAVFIAAYFLFEPAHNNKTQYLVYRRRTKRKKRKKDTGLKAA